ncbi:hypothetical protein BpHYR1_016243 [Brachionus plicatilis]|uniref:Uncharacterized protein n=1 Tax=Brachionus plicatilis TaxID=10195 RepID=A0A3M7RIV4_BRAPC|nr:hypothetical protein BpHYR1_016243 [Brachionus plicatilis]
MLVEVLGVVVVVEEPKPPKGLAAVEDELNRPLEPKPLEVDCAEDPKSPVEVPKPDVVCGNLRAGLGGGWSGGSGGAETEACG